MGVLYSYKIIFNIINLNMVVWDQNGAHNYSYHYFPSGLGFIIHHAIEKH